MVFGKKNKNEIQYYVDQIDRLKEENASLNALIADQKTELQHYKAFFNSNSKLLEASSRMNVACGDIQDAFDNLIDHAEAINFPDQNADISPSVNDLPLETSNDAIVDVTAPEDSNNTTIDAKQNATSDMDVIKDSFSGFFDDDNISDDVSLKSNETENIENTVQESVLPKDQILLDENNHGVSETNNVLPEETLQQDVFLEEEPLFENENTVDETKSFDSISGKYATKSEMIAGHVDSLFAMDEQNQNNDKTASEQSDVLDSVEQSVKTEATSKYDELFEESKSVNENENSSESAINVGSKNHYFSNSSNVMTETEPIDIKSISSENDNLSFSSNDQFNTSYSPEPNFKSVNSSFEDSTSNVSANVDKLFDEDLMISDETKPAFQEQKDKPADSSLEDNALNVSRSEVKSEQDIFDVTMLDESDDELQGENAHYAYESTPKGQHIAFDESTVDSSKPEDIKDNDLTNEADKLFETDDMFEKETDQTDVFTDIPHLDVSETKKSNADDKANRISETRARIASIDFHEEIAWIKPKRNARKRKYSYLSKN